MCSRAPIISGLASVYFSETARNADATYAGEICGRGENVRKIHRQRVLGAFADLERRHRRSWGNNRIHFFECVNEVLPNQGAHFLRTDVVGVVITGAKHVSAENYSTRSEEHTSELQSRLHL